VDLLQSEKVNLVTARKILQEIISGNPQSPSEVGQQGIINLYCYLCYKNPNVKTIIPGSTQVCKMQFHIYAQNLFTGCGCFTYI
jgi:hypothetical protein